MIFVCNPTQKVSLNKQLSDTFNLNLYKKAIFCNGSDYIIISSGCQLHQSAIFPGEYRKLFDYKAKFYIFSEILKQFTAASVQS